MTNAWGSPEPSAGRERTLSSEATPASSTSVTRRAAAAAARVEDADRALAVREVKRRRDFMGALGSWVSVSAITTTIWVAIGAHGYFWPIWPMIGIGIGVVDQAASIWGPTRNEISEVDIAAEMQRREKRGR